MIRFKCEHCGWPVRVPPAYAGKTGRCPSCGALVHIPGQPEVAQLAQALRGGHDGSPDSRTPPPPPLPEYPIDNDDVELPEENASHKTDIMPAEELLSPAEAKRRRRAARQAAQGATADSPPLRHTNARFRLFILLATALILITIALAAYFIFGRG